VVLFDEIEKAHPEVWNSLLQILEDGRLTDGQGHVVDFRNTVIIMTSNIGTAFVKSGGTLGFLQQDALTSQERQLRENIERDLKQTFRPEFLNRIDEIIEFASLGEGQLAQIVRIQIKRFEKLLAERQITLHLSDKAVAAIAEAGYDPVYGARPLKRALQKLVIDPLATHLLAGDFLPGDVIEADVSANGILFTKNAKGAAA
jgi:ATP-dependent Clp protease ATP-binding subunit ClpC